MPVDQLDIEKLIAEITAAPEGTRELESKLWYALMDTPLATGDPVHAPRWTRDLTAAVSLFPKGWCKTVADFWIDGEDTPPYFADCADLAKLKAGKGDVYEATAHTMELAAIAAALTGRLAAGHWRV